METVLERLATDCAAVVPELDARLEHERWQPGIGPFEEDEQIRRILGQLPDREIYRNVERSVRYPGSRKQCDIVITREGDRFPVEAKLLRFKRDNGNEDPNRYTTIFSPFNANNPTTLMHDGFRLYESGFELNGGLLGIYYEREQEELEQMDVNLIAEKFAQDVSYWYEFNAEIASIAPFDGLRHPVFQQGAVVTWRLVY